MTNGDFAGRTILITGASGGIGSAVARAASAAGGRVIVHCHRNLTAARELAATLPAASLVVQADLRDESAVDAMYQRIADDEGRIDGVVANAGVWPPASEPVATMTLTRWQATIDTDLTGVFLTCRGFLRQAANHSVDDASIVLVGSTAAMFGEAGHADYAAAKAALVYGLTSSLKNEIVDIAPHGRVNAVCPGWTDTAMAETGGDERNHAFATMPLKKMATPEDVAEAVLFLLSPTRAGHVTGVVLPVAGGMEGRLNG